MQRFVCLMALMTAWAWCGVAQAAPAVTSPPIVWHAWSEDVFVAARAQKRFVLLDLEAIWCHWCHVMDETTYQDHDVVRLIDAQYLAVRVDQDADPALAVRYQDYGWPATIVLAADGSEIVKRRGYLPPAAMASMLAAIIKDPSPGPSVAAPQSVQPAHSAILAAATRQALVTSYLESYDTQYAGWGSVQKFIDADSLEYALAHAKREPQQAAMARATLNAALALIDPVWGGVYQYSDERDWKSPHFEKIMSFQTQYIRLYADAYRVLGDPAYLKAAQAIDGYVENFLTSPQGTVYTSQDADVNAELTGHVFYALNDAERRRRPNPPIDQHVYARENGWAIAAWAALYDATGNAQYIARARRAADWISAQRALGDGGFAHGEQHTAAAALGDSLAMGQGFLALYAATGERAWLDKARQTAQFIGAHFAVRDGGYATVAVSAAARGVFKDAVRDADENIAVARFANALYRYSGTPAYRNIAQHAMRYLAAPQLAAGHQLRTGILLADAELGSEPTHDSRAQGRRERAGAAPRCAALSECLSSRGLVGQT